MLTTAPAAPNGTNGWFVSDPTITLTCTDNAGGSGCFHTYYKLDGGGQVTYAGPFLLNTDLSHSIEFWSVDNVGNIESPHNFATVKVDTVKPSSTVTLAGTMGQQGYYRSSVTLTFTGSDVTSGLGTLQYSLDAGAWTPIASGGTLVVAAQGTHTISVQAIDVAGNTEVAHTAAAASLTGGEHVRHRYHPHYRRTPGAVGGRSDGHAECRSLGFT